MVAAGLAVAALPWATQVSNLLVFGLRVSDFQHSVFGAANNKQVAGDASQLTQLRNPKKQSTEKTGIQVSVDRKSSSRVLTVCCNQTLMYKLQCLLLLLHFSVFLSSKSANQC